MNHHQSHTGARTSWLLISVLAATSAALGADVAGAEIGSTTRTAPSVAEARVDGPVRPDDGDVLTALLSCRAGVSRAADAQERWGAPCRAWAVEQATVIAFEARCRTATSAAADTSEAWSDVCHQRAVAEAAAQVAHVECVREADTADTAERTC